VSRIGRKPIPVPKGVKVAVEGRTVTAVGTKGSVQVVLPELVTVGNDGAAVSVVPGEGALPGAWGLARSLVSNAIEGVTTGFQKRMLIVGVGYRAEVAGSKLTLFVGYSHSVVIEAPKQIRFIVEPATTVSFKGTAHPTVPVMIQGVDKQLVGDLAAKIRAIRPPEPYLGKGIRYENERVRTDKTGKSAK